MAATFETFKSRLQTVVDLNAASALLGWDRETYMPPAGSAIRAEQSATLARLAHNLVVGDEMQALLEEAEAAVGALPSDSDEARLVAVARWDVNRRSRVPEALVVEMARVTGVATSVWRDARAENNYDTFKPYLTRIIELHRQLADFLGYEEHPYDALLEGYEPGMRTRTVRALFETLRETIVPLSRAIHAQGEANRGALLQGDFDARTQLAFSELVIERLGFDFKRGRQDLSAHPFCQSFSPMDVRITTRVNPTFLGSCLFGSIHETGHALYEMGIDPTLARTPLANGVSLGLHESQSRLWENVVGRSRPFWNYFYPLLQAHFPRQFDAVSLDDFYRAVNASAPSLVRIEADEVTYNLHIMLRFELELALLEGQLTIDDLPDAWNELSNRYLDVSPPSNAMGVMQDTHWASGLFGYFPTYTLGNVLSVQLYEAALAQHPTIPDEMAEGRFETLLGWMRENIHRHGRKFWPEELLTRATGRGLDPAPYVRYLRTKYSDVYGLTLPE